MKKILKISHAPRSASSFRKRIYCRPASSTTTIVHIFQRCGTVVQFFRFIYNVSIANEEKVGRSQISRELASSSASRALFPRISRPWVHHLCVLMLISIITWARSSGSLSTWWWAPRLPSFHSRRRFRSTSARHTHARARAHTHTHSYNYGFLCMRLDIDRHREYRYTDTSGTGFIFWDSKWPVCTCKS